MSQRSSRARRAIASVLETLESRLLMARLAGIDVSNNNGTITWSAVKSDGYTYAWTKATEGFTFNDSTLGTNMTGAKNAGVLIGAYHFARYDNQLGISGADSEASHFWGQVQQYIVADGKHLVPVLDIENTPTHNPGNTSPPYTKTTLSQWVVEWLTDIKNDAAAIGINLTPLVYTGASFAGTWLDSTVAQSFPVWMANYNGLNRDTGSPFLNGSGTLTYGSPWQTPNGWQFWQYTSSQSVPGSGTYDADVFKGSVYDLNNYIIGAAPRWAVNARVVTNASVSAWATSAANTTFTTVASGVQGTIISTGDVYGNSFWRWQVHFDNGVTGWVGEDFMDTLTPAASTAPAPANNLTTNALPTNFTWTAGANASSFKVYLDGTLKSTVTSPSWAHTSISQGAHTWRVDSINQENTTTGTTWSFTFDTVAPTITSVTSTAANGSYGLGASLPITVTFSEPVTVTGTPQLSLNDGGVANYSSGSGSSTLTFNYVVGSGQNTSDLDYASTSALSLNAGAIRDAATNNATLTLPSPGAANSLGANKNILVDTTPPAPAYGSQNAQAGGATLDFTVTFSDGGSGINVSTFDNSDMTVTGPNGFSANPAFVSVDNATNGSPRTVTYRISAPSGSWDATDNGTYTVSINANQVKDLLQNATAAGVVGTFDADFPFAYLSGSTLIIDYAIGHPPLSIGDDGAGHITVTENSTTFSFTPAAFSNILVHGDSLPDDVTIATALNKPLVLDGQTGDDSITIANGGSYTFASDAAAQSASMSIIVNAGGSATFSATQHLNNLAINGAASVTPGDGITLVTQALTIGGKLDLADGALAVSYNVQSPIGAWNGAAYDGITGLVATGRNGGSWNGATGIVTTMADAQTGLTTVGVAEASTSLGLTSGATALWRNETIDDTTVLIRYTYVGDANLSGDISGDDYFLIDSGYGSQGHGFGNGDFNYSGRINADDYFAIDSNYSQGLSALAAPVVTPAAPLVAAAPVISPVANVFASSPDGDAQRKLLEELL